MKKSLKFIFSVFGSMSLFLILLVAGITLFFYISENNYRAKQDIGSVNLKEDPSKPNAPKMKLSLGTLYSIGGSDTHYIDVYGHAEVDFGSINRYGRQTHNILFFEGDEMRTHWLLSNHESVILRKELLSANIKRRLNEEEHVTAILFEVLNDDTNNDKILDKKDNSLIILTRSDGTHKKHIAENVENLIDVKTNRDGTELTLLLKINNAMILKRFSLDTFQEIANRELVDLTDRDLNMKGH